MEPKSALVTWPTTGPPPAPVLILMTPSSSSIRSASRSDERETLKRVSATVWDGNLFPGRSRLVEISRAILCATTSAIFGFLGSTAAERARGAAG